MATEAQQSRRRRAISIVEQRIEFWSAMKEETVEIDGKVCNPIHKLSQAQYELMRLKSKP